MIQINRVAVLGGGVMGSTIAAHLANAGLEVLMLDILSQDITEEERAKGLTLESPEVRNALAAKGLKNAIKAKPAAFFLKEYASLVEVGNFDDDMEKIRNCDWVIEVVVENMEIKKKFLAEKVVPNIAEGTVLSTNTSGLSVNEMARVLPESVRKNFILTHFFNPPRYMRLVEIAPCRDTNPDVVSHMADFIGKRLGKGIVYAKDTPNFVGNRIGIYAMLNSIKHMLEMGLTVEEVDTIAGPATARPKTAMFRTGDFVGIDTLVHVVNNSYRLLTEDEDREIFKVPEFIAKMVDKGLLGNKTGKGFYRKEKSAEGTKIFYYDYRTGEYKPLEKAGFVSIQSARQLDDPAKRLKAVITGKDKAAEFAWKNLRDTLIYTVKRIPEISDDIVNVDNAMKWGFNWELGPFEMLDALDVRYFVDRTEKDGVAVPEALKKAERFYKYEGGRKFFYDLGTGGYREVPFRPDRIKLEILRQSGGVVEENAGCSLVDLGDGVFCCEFHSKMNSIGGDILSMTLKAIRRAEKEGVGLVVGNQGGNFSVGANLMLIAVALAEGAFDDIDMMVRTFQRTTMALKYATVPVVAAPFNMTLGGGCEFAMHADAINAYAETYMGLVEVGVGLLPAGGGTKEMAIRAMALADKYGTDVSPYIFKFFKNIGLAKVSTSAAELYDMGYMREGDAITMNSDSLPADAKLKVLTLARNYRPKKPLKNLKAPGRSVGASIKSQIWNLKMGGFATGYDAEIGGIIADVITGGDVPSGTLIHEQYLLDLEREGFLRLCGNKKTAERIRYMLKKGKPLRN